MISYPINGLTIDISDRCNHRCMHCSTNATPKGRQELSDEVILKVVNEFKKLQGEGKNLSLSGGEPFFRWDLLEKVLNNTLDITIAIFTSGYPLTMEGLRLLIGHRGHVSVHLSIYSDFPYLHDQITGVPGSFGNAIKTTKALKAHNLYVGWHFPLLSVNKGYFTKVVSNAIDLKVDMLSVLRLVPQGRAKSFPNLFLTDREMSDFVQFLYIISKSFHDNIKIRAGCPINFFFLFDPIERPQKCKAGITEALVEPNGTVIPCAAFKGLKYFAGNVKEKSFTEIWNYSQVLSFLRALKDEPLNGKCSSCYFGESCRGRCLAQRIIRYGDCHTGPDPICPLGIQDNIISEDLGRLFYEREVYSF
ncbi:MAG: radical SAM protein [Nitrospirota bacterium]